jgi:hypothetical protein
MLNQRYFRKVFLTCVLSVAPAFSVFSAHADGSGVCNYAAGEILVPGAVTCEDYSDCAWQDRPNPHYPIQCTCTLRKEQFYACVTPPPNSSVVSQGVMFPTIYGVNVDDEHCAGLPLPSGY